MGTVTIRYFAAMASVAGLDLVFSVIAVIGHRSWEFVPSTFLWNAVFPGALLMTGAWWIFRPVARYVAGSGSLEEARSRVFDLARLSSWWTMAVMVPFVLVKFWANPLRLVQDLGGTVARVDLPSLTVVYTVFFGFLVYFLISDFAMGLKIEVFQRYRLPPRVVPVRFAAKFILVVSVCSLVPMLALLGELFTLPAESLRSYVIQSAVSAVIGLTVAVYVVARNFGQPLTNLTAAFDRVRRGDLEARVPVATSDEIGSLTAAFNDMVDGLREREFIADTLGRFAAPGVADAVRRDRAQLTVAEREGTVLVADLVDLNNLTRRLPPDEIIRLLDRYLDITSGALREAGGTLVSWVGDQVLAAFNMPVELADHAPRAIDCALEILQAVAAIHLSDGSRARARVGLSSGRVMAGALGKGSYGVLGDEVNLAFRFNRLNKQYGSSLLVSEATIALDAGRHKAKPIGQIAFGGGRRLVGVYRIHD